ncbi:hypothetical protein IGI04_020562 [Brassica rapa subsp. trilocularis]|uniref:CCHC-type domain-containing protein n=1 Tax=Brassica rapa subsp. trilocularis TaxID=1813537 RepID=A0ABQ7MJ30_BRACM|nr:hypothetical protein IGI04_020562 [Brassica rapa subsp. trilocularis]
MKGLRIELKNSCNVREFRSLNELMEKAAEQEAGLEEERKQNQATRAAKRPRETTTPVDNGTLNDGSVTKTPNITCQLCGRYGHAARDCRDRTEAGTGAALPAPPLKKPATQPRVFVAGNIQGAETIAGRVKVGGVVAYTLFDTGATHSFVSQALTKKWNFQGKYEARTTRVETAGPDEISAMGLNHQTLTKRSPARSESRRRRQPVEEAPPPITARVAQVADRECQAAGFSIPWRVTGFVWIIKGKNRGAGKIESRRVLAGRGRNTLQRVDCIQGTGCRVYPGQAASQECSKKRGGMVRLSCVVNGFLKSVLTEYFPKCSPLLLQVRSGRRRSEVGVVPVLGPG